VIAAPWSAAVLSYAWQVTLHSFVLGTIFYIWTHRVVVPSGRAKRRLLVLVLVLPMLTAAVPGRASLEFAEGAAWANSARLLSIPILAGFRLEHVVFLIAMMAVVLTIGQEILPVLRRPATNGPPPPEPLVALVRSQPGWNNCGVAVYPHESVMMATGGAARRPHLFVSQGALETLSATELEAALAHEHAHWQAGRWFESHALFAVRLLQCYNPVALWVFREYSVEVEIACDAAAVRDRHPRVLARVLLRIYERTDPRDVAARAALRKRVDVLLGGGPADDALPQTTVAMAGAVMALVLPWIV